jgi:hypothetical protein
MIQEHDQKVKEDWCILLGYPEGHSSYAHNGLDLKTTTLDKSVATFSIAKKKTLNLT